MASLTGANVLPAQWVSGHSKSATLSVPTGHSWQTMRQLRCSHWSAALAMQAVGRLLLAHDKVLTPQQQVAYMIISVGLVTMAGLMSGLTLGLMSMDLVDLEVLKRSGTCTEQKYASAIAPVVRNQHFLLVTLLLCNAVSMEALPLFLDRLADPITAIVISVTAVLVFGEILPQAVCSRYGLAIGYYCTWLVRTLMVLTSPISYPIGKLLDFLLGSEHRALFRRGQLKALVDIHGADEGLGGNLTEDEIKVICGALDLTNKTARKSMTPLNKVFMLPANARLNQATMRSILASGHSRIPVYTSGDRSNIIGLILVKELLQYKTHQEVPVSEVRMRSLPRLAADTPMYDLLKLFQTGRSHMVVLTDTPATARAAAAAQAAAGSDDRSVSAAGSPLASVLRGGKGRKQRQKEQQQLLSHDSSQSNQQAGGAWIASTPHNAADGEADKLPKVHCGQPDQKLLHIGFSSQQLQQAGGSGSSSWAQQQQQQQWQGSTCARTAQQPVREQELVSSSPRCFETSDPYSSSYGSSTLGQYEQQHQSSDQQQQYSGLQQDSNCSNNWSLSASHPPWNPALAEGAVKGVPVPIGIITIEDVIEELMQAEIVDETDLFVDNERSISVNAAALAQSLPAQLRLALAPLPPGAAGAAGGAHVTVRKLIKQRSSSRSLGGPQTGGGGATGGWVGVSGSNSNSKDMRRRSEGDGGIGGGGGVAAAAAGLAAAAAAALTAGGSSNEGHHWQQHQRSDRQPLLSSAERCAPSS